MARTLLLGGDGNDVVDGQQGDDVALLGAGDDTFQWDPGDGSDTVEGQDGNDTMTFNGSNAGGEHRHLGQRPAGAAASATSRNVTMDTNDVEAIDVNTVGGQDTVVLNDISGTDLARIGANLAATGGGDDQQADNVVVNATANADVVVLSGQTGTRRCHRPAGGDLGHRRRPRQ